MKEKIPSDTRLRLVLESGATTCRYLCYFDQSVPLFRGKTRGVNYSEEGADGLNRLFNDLNHVLSPDSSPNDSKDQTLNPAFIGISLAGAGRRDVRDNAIQDIRQVLPGGWGREGLYLFHDGETALWTTLGDTPGITVTAGTGSIAFARTPDGRELRAGGWGNAAGDEGSAYWISISAIQCVLRLFDGRSFNGNFSPSVLEGALCRALALGDIRDIVAWVHHPLRKKEDIASLAPLVEEAAHEGDFHAQSILEDAARELGELVLALQRRGNFTDSVSVGITGSIFLKNTIIREHFSALLRKENPGIHVLPPVHDNLQGTVKLTERAISG